MKQRSSSEKHWIYFKSGNLNDIYLYTTDFFSQFYPDGNTDNEMMASIEENNASGKVIFDVGAFIGASSLVFSKLVGNKGKVVAFEPNPYNLLRIEKILPKNPKYGKNIIVFPFALSDNNKKIDMNLSEAIDVGHSSTSRIVGSHSTIRDSDLPEGFKNVEVQAKTLDSFVAEQNILPDILKVDIEGAEYEFLLGAVETIRKVHPTFYIELHSQYCAAKCTEFLILEGYSIKVIHEEEDGRIMVLAEHVHESSSGADVEKLRSFNDSFSILKNMSDSLATLNKEVQIKDSQILEINKENDKLRTENMRVSGPESVNEVLFKKIADIESSWSWKITKPLRKAMYALRAIKR